MLQKILNYWYQLEFFNPCWPVNTHEDTDLTKKGLPWEKPQTNPNILVSYDVYFGRARANELVAWMLDMLELRPEGTAIENDNSLVCLCALKIDEQGRYVADSFIISSFVWAICKLVEAGSINAKLDILDIEMLQQKINNQLLQDYEERTILSISKDYLDGIYSLTSYNANINRELFKATLWSRRKVQYANKDGIFPRLDPSTELLQSFYLKDIKKIQNNPTPKIQSYVDAMNLSKSQAERVQIDTDV